MEFVTNGHKRIEKSISRNVSGFFNDSAFMQWFEIDPRDWAEFEALAKSRFKEPELVHLDTTKMEGYLYARMTLKYKQLPELLRFITEFEDKHKVRLLE